MQVFGRRLDPAVSPQLVSSAVISAVVQTTVSSTLTGRHDASPWHHSYGSPTLLLQCAVQKPDPAPPRAFGTWSVMSRNTFSARL